MRKKGILYTSLERMRQEQKDFQETTQEIVNVGSDRDKVASSQHLTRDDRTRIAVELGNYRRILLAMSEQRWPDAAEKYQRLQRDQYSSPGYRDRAGDEQ